jgi:hypothetical protein
MKQYAKEKASVMTEHILSRLKKQDAPESIIIKVYIENELIKIQELIKELVLNELELGECKTCEKRVTIDELNYNAKFGGYGFQSICNECASEIDRKQDEQQQDKA